MYAKTLLNVALRKNIPTFTFGDTSCIYCTLSEKSVKILVTGLVQGVGFRPFVFRIANRFGLTGWVQNTNENVTIEITGRNQDIINFISSLKADAPPAAIIENIAETETETKFFNEFIIIESHDVSDEITEISPDIAVCNECLEDMEKPGNRLDYAFVNCTNCGPRFTIIEDLPYDRAKTTMRSFTMCPGCKNEYETITNRRFHAQPVACNICGPQYELIIKGKIISNDIHIISDHFSQCIANGGIVLIKGLGGMHLACDAFNEKAVSKLRDLKKRDGKPFALMFRDIESLKLYAKISTAEEATLISWRRPITLLEKKKRTTPPLLPDNINAGLNMLGVMLPYMPLHSLLFRKLSTPAIVLTSGNFSNEPILTDNSDATGQFTDLIDALVLHNRAIFNRTDDSVVRIIGNREKIFRRSRGYAPAPVRTSQNTDGILAFGAELTNCFCVGKGEKAFLSQHIGDLQSVETALFYEKTIAQFIKLFRIKPSLLAADMHPDYISTKTALNFGNLPVVMVQHHHAHITSCMAEHRLDEKVIGVAFDGTGYGTDGNTWGSEFLICDLKDFKRISHFEYIALPGGDSAIEEPWKVAVSWLYRVFGRSFLSLDIPMMNQIDRAKVEIIIKMIDKNINCPLTSGAGRFFDAIASVLGLVQIATFQAEGPMRLESLVQHNLTESYPFTFGEKINFDETIRAIVKDILNNTEKTTIATKLHNTIILTIFDTVSALRLKEGINKVVLSGGVFQNKYLLEGTTELLQRNYFEVYSHASVPTNDGGIALGQLAVASKRRELKCV
jgi:hydrogenase maturation protein HypF